MLERVDRMQIAVEDRCRAAETFCRLLGAAVVREEDSACLNAARTVLALGESELELCAPRGAGPIAEHLARWGEGLFAAGYATSRLEELAAHLETLDAPFVRDGTQLQIPGTTTAGMPMVISPLEVRPRVGPVSFLYEATNALDSDWRAASDLYTRLFRLEPAKFSTIESSRFNYAGTLTLFAPPHRLDRIELSQTFTDRPGAMRRFVERRGGDSLYMCYVEAHDFRGLKQRLAAGGATLIPRGPHLAAEHDGLWVHPKSLHGVLLGVSRTSLAWGWSGRPELVLPSN
ncbi:MAG: VOC family protein [Gammaproteobacteria bacterium]|nr:VOC family protein [Gammaproteobacteria bacterium]